jgi:hypothetical protein
MKLFFKKYSGRFNGLLRTPLSLRSSKRFLTECSISLTQALRSLVLVGLILFISSCSKDTPQKEYERNFVLKVLYDQSTKSKTTPLQACIESYNSTQTCVATSTEFSALTLTERILSATLTENRLLTFQDICQTSTSLPSIPSLGNDLSDSMRVCVFNCNKSYFDTRKNLNTCTGTFASIFSGIGTDSGTTRCRIDCLKTTNN